MASNTAHGVMVMSDRIKPRNPVARSPLLRKGGVHEIAKSGDRQSNRISLSIALEDWEDDLAFEREMQDINRGQQEES